MVAPRTLTEIVFQAFDRFAREDHFAFKKDGRWQTLSTQAARERVTRLAGALARAGINPGDRVAIISPTRLEWSLADFAIGAVRGVVVPVYPTLNAPQIAYILRHSGARLAFVAGAEEHGKLLSGCQELPELRDVVSFDALDPPPAEPAAERAGRDAPPARAKPRLRSFEELLARSGTMPSEGPLPDDLASIIYTSGTTGDPKGVMLTHANIVANVLACTEACPFEPSDVHLSFLPLSHIFERMVSYYMIWNGLSVRYAEDLSRIKDNLGEVRPTILTSVPRVLEKVLAGVEEQARRGGPLKQKIAGFAIETARAWARARYRPSGRVSLWLSAKHALADRLVLRRIREVLGGRVRAVITGGSATPAVITELFNGLGVRVLPGYGLTEFSPVIAFNTLREFRLGSVGRPIPGVEVKIAPDGEILARGASLMRGYYLNSEATAAAIDAEGWLHTGDIGVLDADGYLQITDRKKDLIATAGGKKVAPQPIEEALAREPLIAQVVLVGEGRPFIGALIVPNFAALEAWARSRKLAITDRAALVTHPEVQDLYRLRLEVHCASFARYETVKRFAFLLQELSEATGELTPTLKVKRRVIVERHAGLIDGLYADGATLPAETKLA